MGEERYALLVRAARQKREIVTLVLACYLGDTAFPGPDKREEMRYLGTDIIPGYFVYSSGSLSTFVEFFTSISDAYMCRKSADARAASCG